MVIKVLRADMQIQRIRVSSWIGNWRFADEAHQK